MNLTKLIISLMVSAKLIREMSDKIFTRSFYNYHLKIIISYIFDHEVDLSLRMVHREDQMYSTIFMIKSLTLVKDKLQGVQISDKVGQEVGEGLHRPVPFLEYAVNSDTFWSRITQIRKILSQLFRCVCLVERVHLDVSSVDIVTKIPSL